MPADFPLSQIAAPWWWSLALGVGLDLLLGEPRRWHPLVGFGRLAQGLEGRLNRAAGRAGGVLAWSLAVAPPVGAFVSLHLAAGPRAWVLDALALYFALGARSLFDHLLPVAQALERGDLAAGRAAVQRVVTRDCAALDETAVAGAAVESTLENGNDAVFATLFWFALAGGAGALAFRLANTLDAMWGYRTERFLRFGWAAARIDDVLNWAPARLTAATYAVLGHTRRAWRCWCSQARAWDSPNAGPVMAAGAGALGLRLGGQAVYHGRVERRPALGEGAPPGAHDVRRALQLVGRSLALWVVVMLVLNALS